MTKEINLKDMILEHNKLYPEKQKEKEMLEEQKRQIEEQEEQKIIKDINDVIELLETIEGFQNNKVILNEYDYFKKNSNGKVKLYSEDSRYAFKKYELDIKHLRRDKISFFKENNVKELVANYLQKQEWFYKPK